MTKTISRTDLAYVLDQTGFEFGPISDTYMGLHSVEQDPCMSFILPGKRGIQRDLCRFFMELAVAMENHLIRFSVKDAENLAANVSTDDLGLDMIVYFPGWKLSD